jgi:hypothetical protein
MVDVVGAFVHSFPLPRNEPAGRGFIVVDLGCLWSTRGSGEAVIPRGAPRRQIGARGPLVALW